MQSKSKKESKSMAIHTFNSTGEAYDHCNSSELITVGDIVHVPSEGVVGIADAWPVAVTIVTGHFHRPADGYMLIDYFGEHFSQGEVLVSKAKAFALAQGYEIRK